MPNATACHNVFFRKQSQICATRFKKNTSIKNHSAMRITQILESKLAYFFSHQKRAAEATPILLSFSQKCCPDWASSLSLSLCVFQLRFPWFLLLFPLFHEFLCLICAVSFITIRRIDSLHEHFSVIHLIC